MSVNLPILYYPSLPRREQRKKQHKQQAKAKPQQLIVLEAQI